jgi:S-adenosylmethionine:tRNA-ribosyltransferase-isomerase (queuine synthetase)
MLVEFGKANLLQKARQQPDKVKMVIGKIKSEGLKPTMQAVFNKLGQPLPLGYCNAGKVIAVGTTSVRALESAATLGETEGRTRIFIHRPYEWKTVDVMMTNFHMPRTTLLMMIDAFVGARWRNLYDTALAENYRFLSFGDAMLLDRSLT